MIALHFLKKIYTPIGFLYFMCLPFSHANTLDLRGNIAIESRFFYEMPLFDDQKSYPLSFSSTPEFFWSWNDNKDTFEWLPFARYDSSDANRTHFDIRELSWVHILEHFESKIGIRREFWGVTEFQHLVDVINQKDYLEGYTNEQKLGQPMVNFSWVQSWGSLDFYWLPYFRERSFSALNGRPTIGINVITDNQLIANSDGLSQISRHRDWALRWNHSFSNYDLAIHWFEGIDKSPKLLPYSNKSIAPPYLFPMNNSALNHNQMLNDNKSVNTIQTQVAYWIPHYSTMKQMGLELQINNDETLLKLEWIYKKKNNEHYWALQTGIEYTHYALFETAIDFSWLIEYAYDQRQKKADSSFQNDLFIGNRIAFNNVDSTEILWGFRYDVDFDSIYFLIEAHQRITNNITLSLDAYFFSPNKEDVFFYSLRQDDHLQFTLQYYY
jgi:hypothetical protein